MFPRTRRLVVFGCVLSICYFGAVTGWSQVPRVPNIRGLGGINRPGSRDQRRPTTDQQAQQQLQKLPPLETIGTIEAVIPGYIKLVTEAKQTWVIQVLPSARCQLTGKATPAALAPGYFIRFLAEVNKRGAVEQKIEKLTVFTPSQYRQVGAEPDTGLGSTFGPRPGEEPADAAKPKPAFGAALPDPALAAAAKKAGAQLGAAGQRYDIRGQIVGVVNGRLNLHVPNIHFRPSLRVEVAENADIDVELDDPMCYTLARKGDKVRIQGRQGLGNQGIAEQVDIALSEPLAAHEQDGKKPAKGPRAKRQAPADDSSDSKSPDSKTGKKKADESDIEKKTDTAEKEPADDNEAAAKSTKNRSPSNLADAPEKPGKKKNKPGKTSSDE